MYLLAECDRLRSMPVGFFIPNPGGMAENSPAFQRRDQVMRALSPEGTAEPRCLSRPFGTHSSPNLKPGVEIETPGYSHFVPSGLSSLGLLHRKVTIPPYVRNKQRVGMTLTKTM